MIEVGEVLGCGGLEFYRRAIQKVKIGIEQAELSLVRRALADSDEVEGESVERGKLAG